MPKILLVFILATFSLITHSIAPFSIVASRYFASYQRTMISNSLNGSNDQFYPLTFTDVHNNTVSSAVVLCGYQISSTRTLGFQVDINTIDTVSSNIKLHINGNFSVISKISIFLIMISTSASSCIQIKSDVQTGLNLAGTGIAINSSSFPVTTTIAPFQYYAFLKYFTFNDTNATDISFTVSIIQDSIAGQTVNFKFATNQKNILDEVGFTIIFFQRTIFTTIPLTFYFDAHQTFSTLIGNANSTSTLDFSMGYNRICGFGEKQFIIPTSNVDFVDFDANLNATNILSASSLNPFKMTIFCLYQSINCTLQITECIQCLSYTQCTDCTPKYFVNSLHLCQICTNPIQGCLQCQNSTTCILCDYPSYITDNNGSCINCTTYINKCQICSNITQCVQCLPGYGLLNITYCQICNLMVNKCSLCLNSTYCTQCLTGYFIQFTNNTCISCNVIPNCLTCLNASICTNCISQFYLDSDNFTCLCNPGLYPVTGFCSCLGCISAQKFNSTTYCLACDVQNNFVLSNGTCLCKLGFSLINKICTQICSDGMTINAACDDGNHFSGDGCSSQCIVEPGYSCTAGNLTNSSKCVYTSAIQVSLSSINRLQTSNTAQILLTISPTIGGLDKMIINDFSSYISLSIGTAPIHYSASYDQNGNIRILIDYTSDLQGLPVSLTLNYDPNYISHPPTTMNFDMAGSNLPISYYQHTQNDSLITVLGYGVVGITFLQFILSLAFHKMIGLQTIQISQIIFYIRFGLLDSSSMSLHSLNSLKYLNIYNFMATYPNIRTLWAKLIRMGLSKAFIFNVLIQIGIIIICWIVYQILQYKINKIKQKGILNQTTVQIQTYKTYVTLSSKFQNSIFIFTTYSIFIIFFSYLSSSQAGIQLLLQLPTQMMFIALAIIIYTGLYTASQMYNNWKDSTKYNQDEGFFYRYISIFLIYQVTITVMIMGFGTLPIGKYAIGSVATGYLIFLIGYRPYYFKSHNVILILNQSILLFFIALLIMIDLISLDNKIIGLIVIGYEGLLIVIGILAIVRLYIHSKYNKKAFDAIHLEQEKAKGKKDNFNRDDFNKVKAKITNNIGKMSIFARKKEQQMLQLTQLQKLKKRLKGQYYDQLSAEQPPIHFIQEH